MGYKYSTPLFIIHVGCIYCMLVGAIGGLSFARDIRDQAPKLRRPPYPPGLYLGNYLSGIFCTFGAVQSVLALFPLGTLACSSHSTTVNNKTYMWLFLSCVSDGIITIGLSVAAVIQAGYIPSPLGTCYDLDKLGPYPGGEPHWLDVLAPIRTGRDSEKVTRAGICDAEAMIWKMEVAMAIVSGILTLLTALLLKLIQERDASIDRFPKFLTNLCGLITIILWLGKWIRYLNHRRHRLNRTKAILNSLCEQQTQQGGNSSRFGSGGEGENDAREVDVELGLNPTTYYSPSKNEQYLIRILGSYEMAHSIASSCHFTDFRSLMLVSKGLRKATFECMDWKNLTKKTCLDSAGEDKSTCGTCGNQICASCKITHRSSKETTFHIENCSPYCSSCFRKTFCKRPIYEAEEEPKNYWTPLTCLGHGSRESRVSGQPTGGVGCRKKPQRFTPYQYQDDSREVCQLCATALREARSTQLEEQNVLNISEPHPHKNCSGCSKELKPGNGDLVWWGCKICGCECVEAFHQEIWDKGKRVGNHNTN